MHQCKVDWLAVAVGKEKGDDEHRRDVQQRGQRLDVFSECKVQESQKQHQYADFAKVACGQAVEFVPDVRDVHAPDGQLIQRGVHTRRCNRGLGQSDDIGAEIGERPGEFFHCFGKNDMCQTKCGRSRVEQIPADAAAQLFDDDDGKYRQKRRHPKRR